MLRAIADVLRQIGGAVATVVTLPFRAVARLFGVPRRRAGADAPDPARSTARRVAALIPDCRHHLPQLPRNLSEEGGTGS